MGDRQPKDSSERVRAGPNILIYATPVFCGFYQQACGKSRGNTGGFSRVLPLKWLCYVAATRVMQSLHKNENLLFKRFQDFLVQSLHLSARRSPF